VTAKLSHGVARLTLVKGRDIMFDLDFSSNADALVAILLTVAILAVTFI
jgi:hypothetical protein